MPNDDLRRIEVIIGVARRRYWPAHEKLRIVVESLAPGESVSALAKRNGVAPNLLFRWRRLMDKGGAMAVESNEPGVGASEVRKLEDRVRDLERLLGRKTMENEILLEALAKTQAKMSIGSGSWVLPRSRCRHPNKIETKQDLATQSRLVEPRLLSREPTL